MAALSAVYKGSTSIRGAEGAGAFVAFCRVAPVWGRGLEAVVGVATGWGMESERMTVAMTGVRLEGNGLRNGAGRAVEEQVGPLVEAPVCYRPAKLS